MEILILEDSLTSIADLERRLSSMIKDAHIHSCMTYESAMKVAISRPIQVAFIDLRMSGLNGLDFINDLYECELNDKFKKIALSSVGDDSIARQSVESYVDIFLPKEKLATDLYQVLTDLHLIKDFISYDINSERFGEYTNKLYKIYQQENDELIQQLNEAIRADNLTMVREITHRMAGAARTIGETSIEEACKEIEQQANKGFFVEEELLLILNKHYSTISERIKMLK